MGQVLTKNEGFSDFCEGWVPFLLEIKQKAGWLVGMGLVHECGIARSLSHNHTKTLTRQIQLDCRKYSVVSILPYQTYTHHVKLSKSFPGTVLIGALDGGSLQLILSCLVLETFIQ